ncbi:keratin, type II cytoskeletal I-like [Diorhabda carinulata]|uniref:keratin, type II cytoskeletal I-like n=1 Tax=Diorhabda carinulata TaxID=1163345 RepID=UPI0025A00F31|nr:keratin, type II cytoskeletal I-like [Diorhabda carinulata]
MIKLARLLVGGILLYIKYVSGMMSMGGMGMGGMGYGGSGMGYGGGMNLFGGSESSGGSFGQGKKMFDDIFFKKGFGSQEGGFGMGQSGYGSDDVLVKDVKGEMGFHGGHHGGKNIMSDGKGYFGTNHIGHEGL